MKCKFKLPSDELFCQALHGECQFIQSGYGEECPVCNAFRDLELSSSLSAQDSAIENEKSK